MYFDTDQLDLADSVSAFCARECGTREQRAHWTNDGTLIHSRELFKKMAQLGWAGIAIPEEYGGSGGGLVEQCIFFEEASRAMAPVAAAASSQLVAQTLIKFGSEQQKKERLSALTDGDTMSISVSEPDAGSDVSNVSCRATLNDSTLVVNGQKTWASYAHLVDRILLVVRTSRDKDKRHFGLTMLDIDPATAGVEIKGIPTMGEREVNDIYLTDAEFARENVVGQIDQAWKQVMASLNGDRLIIAAQGVGNARRAIADITKFMSERRQFGTTISSFQAMRHRLADLAADVEAAKALTYTAAYRLQNGLGTAGELNRLTSMAKLKATETARNVALNGIQMLGGYGYTTEFDMEHIARNTIAATIYGGTSEIQRDIIAKTLLP
ncbi:acyl-CoA dehydrogenase family protein [Rhodococcus opacus]|uniref:acyl-CoA dehydrogenase family protein n=1 Tax=Rhodococcus opacus TaxID=37919 RepID=UPI0024BA313D|nr:acyl-CoA dehydrogenase family protein [Rhodococcus opacus]MDJ0419881.1 acyl-CoA dehydrogenase family protein [Rhodococcus opacus]MDV6245260.1 acyl-CoA dehydrogenase family protein [Rhodococcus opacus]